MRLLTSVATTLTTAALLLTGLWGCGQKGPLTLPAAPTQTAMPAAAASAASAIAR